MLEERLLNINIYNASFKKFIDQDMLSYSIVLYKELLDYTINQKK